MQEAVEKEKLFRKLLIHPKIEEVRGVGLMLACRLRSPEYVQTIAQYCMNEGLILFWLLFSTEYLRITPPLTITNEEIEKGCAIILKALDACE